MEPHELVGQTYKKKNHSGFSVTLGTPHELVVDLSDWPTDEHQVTLEPDDFPYLKLALIDRHLDERYE